MRGPQDETTLTLRHLTVATLARQLLLAREAVPVVDAVARVGGLQAQEPRPPFLGLWSRLQAFEREQLLEPIRSGEVVRATLMRGTLHLATRADADAWRGPLATDRAWLLRFLGARAEGLDLDAVLPAARELYRERPRTFNEVRAELSARFPAMNDRALGYATRLLVPLAMVPTGDEWGFPRDPAFALAPDPDPSAARSATEALVLRYLAAFGPASVADAQAWTGVKPLKPAFEALRDRLVTFRLEGSRRELFDLPDAPRPDLDAVEIPPRLLPDFDSVVLAHEDRSRIIDDEHRPQLTTKNLRVKATALWEGRAVASWSTEVRAGRATLTLHPFGRALPRGSKGPLEEEARALLAWLAPDARSVAVAVD